MCPILVAALARVRKSNGLATVATRNSLRRKLARVFFELRQLRRELGRVRLERLRAIRAAEVNLLAFVLERVLSDDRLAAHGALGLTREALVQFGKHDFKLAVVIRFVEL